MHWLVYLVLSWIVGEPTSPSTPDSQLRFGLLGTRLIPATKPPVLIKVLPKTFRRVSGFVALSLGVQANGSTDFQRMNSHLPTLRSGCGIALSTSEKIRRSYSNAPPVKICVCVPLSPSNLGGGMHNDEFYIWLGSDNYRWSICFRCMGST
jgi:hypothetical protein